MSSVWIYSLASVFIVSAISLIGVITLTLKEARLKNMLIYLVSFSAGALLGDVFLHILPEIVEEAGFGLEISSYILFGIISTFLIEKAIHWKHAHSPSEKKQLHPVTFMTIFGDGLHNFIDGVIIGTTYLISIPAGIATTIAVIAHEIPQEIGNFGVLLHGGFTKGKALFFNFLSALTAVIGTLFALSAASQGESIIVFLSAYTAGSFIYIAGADLIPELHKETSLRKNIVQFLWLIAGIAAMFALLYME